MTNNRVTNNNDMAVEIACIMSFLVGVMLPSTIYMVVIV